MQTNNLDDRKMTLGKYDLPESLVEFLKSDNLVIKFSNIKDSKYMKFYSYLTTWENKKLLSLVENIHNYSIVDVVWDSSEKMICAIDEEHETFVYLATWDDFFDNIENYMKSYLNGDYNE